MASLNGTRDIDSLNKIMDNFIAKGYDFTLRKIGDSTMELHLPTRKLTAKQSGNYIKGSHLSHLMLLEVEKKLSHGLYTPKNTDNDRWALNTVMYDPDNIYKLLGQPIVAVDIASCYWTTAYNMGLISTELFKNGFKQDREWKQARAAAIGSLATQIKEFKNIDGKLTLVNSYRRPYNIVRLDLIDLVWKIANEISYELRDTFCMFLTDCFFVHAKDESKVYELLAQYDYKAKSKKCVLENIEEYSGYHKIFWSNKDSHNKEIVFKKKDVVSWKK